MVLGLNMGQDTVQIGAMSVPNQTIGLAGEHVPLCRHAFRFVHYFQFRIELVQTESCFFVGSVSDGLVGLVSWQSYCKALDMLWLFNI